MTPQLFGWLHAAASYRATIEPFFRQRWDDESAFQRALLDVLYALTPPDFECWHIPGGGAVVGARAGAWLKWHGTKAGIYDLQCMWLGGDGFLELKAKNALSLAQAEFGAYLTRIGKAHAVARTISEALAALLAWGAPIDPRVLSLVPAGRTMTRYQRQQLYDRVSAALRDRPLLTLLELQEALGSSKPSPSTLGMVLGEMCSRQLLLCERAPRQARRPYRYRVNPAPPAQHRIEIMPAARRRCLGCSEIFTSSGIHNRLCPSCARRYEP